MSGTAVWLIITVYSRNGLPVISAGFTVSLMIMCAFLLHWSPFLSVTFWKILYRLITELSQHPLKMLFWISAVSSVIKHERNVTKIAQIPIVGLLHTDRLFGFYLYQLQNVAVEHLEDVLQTSLTFLFLTQPLAQASCSKRNYVSFMLSLHSLQRESPLWHADNRLGWVALRGFFWTLVLLSSSGSIFTVFFYASPSCPRLFLRIQKDWKATTVSWILFWDMPQGRLGPMSEQGGWVWQ